MPPQGFRARSRRPSSSGAQDAQAPQCTARRHSRCARASTDAPHPDRKGATPAPSNRRLITSALKASATPATPNTTITASSPCARCGLVVSLAWRAVLEAAPQLVATCAIMPTSSSAPAISCTTCPVTGRSIAKTSSAHSAASSTRRPFIFAVNAIFPALATLSSRALSFTTPLTAPSPSR